MTATMPDLPAEGQTPAMLDYDLRTVRFTLDPNAEQVELLLSHIGAARFTYNRLLSESISNFAIRKQEAESGVAEDERTPQMPLTPFGLSKFFNTHKDEWCVNQETGEVWWPRNSTYAYESACAMLGGAYKNFFSSISGKRKGERAGFPKFKSRRDSVAVTFRGKKGLYFDATKKEKKGRSSNRITLPKIGSVRVFEDVLDTAPFAFWETTSLQRAAVRKRRGRWVASVLFRVAPVVPNSIPPKGTIALDLGAMGDGNNIIIGVDDTGDIAYRLEYPEALRTLEERKRMLQRRGRNKVGGQKGVTQSARYKAHLAKVAKIDYDMANIRENLLHEATDFLTRTYRVILIEGLAPKDMMKREGKWKSHMNRQIWMSSFTTVRTQLEYKAERTGSVVKVAPRMEVTNRGCSNCGAVKNKADWRRLHFDQAYACRSCGTEMHRSVNTARNLVQWEKEASKQSVGV